MCEGVTPPPPTVNLQVNDAIGIGTTRALGCLLLTWIGQGQLRMLLRWRTATLQFELASRSDRYLAGHPVGGGAGGDERGSVLTGAGSSSVEVVRGGVLDIAESSFSAADAQELFNESVLVSPQFHPTSPHPYPSQSQPAPPHAILHYPTSPHPIQPYPTLSHPIPYRPILSHPVLSRPT